MAVAIIGTLLALLIPSVSGMINKTRMKKACTDIATIGTKIRTMLEDSGYLPATIDEIPLVAHTDPWGNPYQYLIILGKKKSDVEGQWRKDRFLVPLNSDFDLYSMGKDGKSRPPLTAKDSYDDIIRANNGEFVGEASRY